MSCKGYPVEVMGGHIRLSCLYDLDIFRCVFCNKCELVCPVGAILQSSGMDISCELRLDGFRDRQGLL
jgi:formate hydrogenlyase subunit 6/NADH:ubiquinone oxidoreductase subunit I